MELSALANGSCCSRCHRAFEWTGSAPRLGGFLWYHLASARQFNIGFYEEHNAGNSVKALMDSLQPKAKVERDGK